MNKVVVLLVVLCLGLSSVAMAQGGYGGSYSDEAYQGFRAHLGFAWPGDLDSALVYGGDYIWRHGLATVNILNSEDITLWTLEYSYLLRGQDDPSLYYGGGLGWASASNGDTDTGVLWNVLLGKEFGGQNGTIGKHSWFVEARYNLGSDVGHLNVDGLRVVGGYRF